LEWSCFAVKQIEGGRFQSLRIHHDKTSGFCFMGARNDHPGRIAIIRIGNNQPISYENSMVCGAKARLIIEQLLTEQPGATRGTGWPNERNEFEFDPAGFPAAYEALKQRIADPRP